MVKWVTTNGNEWQRMTMSDVTNDQGWQLVLQRVTASDTTSDKESYNRWQRMITNDSEWQRVIMNDSEW